MDERLLSEDGLPLLLEGGSSELLVENLTGSGVAGLVGAGPSESIFQETGRGVAGTTAAGVRVGFGGRLSQEAVEVLVASVGNARLSQFAEETLLAGTAAARASQVASEVLRSVVGVSAGVSQLAVEVVRQIQTFERSVAITAVADIEVSGEVESVGTTRKIVSQIAVEVVRSARVTGIGPGNGGETQCLKLAPNGTTETAILDNILFTDANLLSLSSDGGFPASGSFPVEIDDEVLLITKTGSGTYRAIRRAQSNTTLATHAAGATVSWNDTYDMAIRSAVNVAADFLYEVDDQLYPGWIMAFDASQAYVGGDHYPMYVKELLGVFPAGDGTTGNKLDAAQPVAAHIPAATSENCPATIGVPGRLIDDIVIGDVGLVRYVNPEASTMTLCDRACGLQVWYGFKRVDDSDVDVTLTQATPAFGTGAAHLVDVTPFSATEGDHGAIEAFHDDPFVTTTLDGDDRYFTHTSAAPGGFSEAGWPLAVLAVRNNSRRVPHWTSPDWHNFSYVYTGFHQDAVFAQILINRNGILYGPEPSVDLPHPNDIDGPNASWDDSSYYSSTSWGVYIFSGAYFFAGPILNDGAAAGQPPVTIIPIVGSPTNPGDDPGVSDPDPFLEGGEGGDIGPPEPGVGVFVNTEGVILPFTPANIQLGT